MGIILKFPQFMTYHTENNPSNASTVVMFAVAGLRHINLSVTKTKNGASNTPDT